MWLGWREGKPQVNPWVSPWRLGTGGLNFQGAQFPSWVTPSAGEQRDQQRGPGHTVLGRLGHLSLGLASGHQKFHIICTDKMQMLSGCTHGYSWPFPPPLSYAPVCHVSGSGLGPCPGVMCRAQPEPARAVPSPHERPRQPWREPRGARAAAAPWRPRPPCDHLPPGGACGPKMADGEDTEHTNPSARQLKPPQTPLG